MNENLANHPAHAQTRCLLTDIHRRKHYLGEQFPETYLTQREAECTFWVIQGLTNKEVADKMQLSSRTIEYYLRNVRCKLNCYSKAHLIKVLKGSGFLTRIDFNPTIS